jgi:UDP-glucose 4-epimerase
MKELFTMIKEMLEGKIEIVFNQKEKRAYHYTITPYTFSPKLGKKLVSNTFVDIGQGILQVMEDIFKKEHKEYKKIANVYIES